MLVAYGDDSSDSRKATVFSVAVVLGGSDQWVSLKSAWEKRNAFIPFHATDCESGWGDYRGVDRDVRTHLYRDLIAMLADSDLFGFAAAVDVKAFKEGYPSEETHEMAYYICLSDVLARCAALGSLTIPPQNIDLIFDQNFERDPSTADLYDYMGALKQWDLHAHLGEKVTFADYRKESGVQVADLLARETMKHMENTMLGSRERWSRISFMLLRSNPRFHFRFVDRKEMASTSKLYPSKLGQDFPDEYKKWRLERGIDKATVFL